MLGWFFKQMRKLSQIDQILRSGVQWGSSCMVPGQQAFMWSLGLLWPQPRAVGGAEGCKQSLLGLEGLCVLGPFTHWQSLRSLPGSLEAFPRGAGGRRKWWARHGALKGRVIRLQLASHCRKGVGERCDKRLPAVRSACDAPDAPEKASASLPEQPLAPDRMEAHRTLLLGPSPHPAPPYLHVNEREPAPSKKRF